MVQTTLTTHAAAIHSFKKSWSNYAFRSNYSLLVKQFYDINNNSKSNKLHKTLLYFGFTNNYFINSVKLRL